MTRWLCCQVVVVVVGASAVVAGEKSDITGKHYRVICYFKNDEIAAQALDTAEAVWPLATRLFGIPDETPKVRGEIRLYRTIADYEAAEADLTDGAFRRHRAFSNYQTKTAYIALQPDYSDAALEKLGLPALTRQVLAHQAVHLFRFAALDNYKSHPSWLASGLGALIWERTAIPEGWSAAAQADPYLSTLMLRASALQKNGLLPTVDRILLDDIDAVDSATRPAVQWLLLRFLAATTGEETLRSIMAHAGQLADTPEYPAYLKAFIETTLGPKRLKTLDAEFGRYVAGLKSDWHEMSPSLETIGEWVQAALPDKNAVAWRTEPVGVDHYTLAGEFKILAGMGQQLNLLLGAGPEGFISIGFDTDGRVVVFDFQPRRTAQWQQLYGVQLLPLMLDKWTPFIVEVAGDQLSVTLGVLPALSTSVKGRSMRGPWGLGAQAGSVGVWRGLTVAKEPGAAAGK